MLFACVRKIMGELSNEVESYEKNSTGLNNSNVMHLGTRLTTHDDSLQSQGTTYTST